MDVEGKELFKITMQRRLSGKSGCSSVCDQCDCDRNCHPACEKKKTSLSICNPCQCLTVCSEPCQSTKLSRLSNMQKRESMQEKESLRASTKDVRGNQSVREVETDEGYGCAGSSSEKEEEWFGCSEASINRKRNQYQQEDDFGCAEGFRREHTLEETSVIDNKCSCTSPCKQTCRKYTDRMRTDEEANYSKALKNKTQSDLKYDSQKPDNRRSTSNELDKITKVRGKADDDVPLEKRKHRRRSDSTVSNAGSRSIVNTRENAFNSVVKEQLPDAKRSDSTISNAGSQRAAKTRDHIYESVVQEQKPDERRSVSTISNPGSKTEVNTREHVIESMVQEQIHHAKETDSSMSKAGSETSLTIKRDDSAAEEQAQDVKPEKHKVNESVKSETNKGEQLTDLMERDEVISQKDEKRKSLTNVDDVMMQEKIPCASCDCTEGCFRTCESVKIKSSSQRKKSCLEETDYDELQDGSRKISERKRESISSKESNESRGCINDGTTRKCFTPEKQRRFSQDNSRKSVYTRAKDVGNNRVMEETKRNVISPAGKMKKLEESKKVPTNNLGQESKRKSADKANIGRTSMERDNVSETNRKSTGQRQTRTPIGIQRKSTDYSSYSCASGIRKCVPREGSKRKCTVVDMEEINQVARKKSTDEHSKYSLDEGTTSGAKLLDGDNRNAKPERKSLNEDSLNKGTRRKSLEGEQVPNKDDVSHSSRRKSDISDNRTEQPQRKSPGEDRFNEGNRKKSLGGGPDKDGVSHSSRRKSNISDNKLKERFPNREFPENTKRGEYDNRSKINSLDEDFSRQKIYGDEEYGCLDDNKSRRKSLVDRNDDYLDKKYSNLSAERSKRPFINKDSVNTQTKINNENKNSLTDVRRKSLDKEIASMETRRKSTDTEETVEVKRRKSAEKTSPKYEERKVVCTERTTRSCTREESSDELKESEIVLETVHYDCLRDSFPKSFSEEIRQNRLKEANAKATDYECLNGGLNQRKQETYQPCRQSVDCTNNEKLDTVDFEKQASDIDNIKKRIMEGRRRKFEDNNKSSRGMPADRKPWDRDETARRISIDSKLKSFKEDSMRRKSLDVDLQAKKGELKAGQRLSESRSQKGEKDIIEGRRNSKEKERRASTSEQEKQTLDQECGGQRIECTIQQKNNCKSEDDDNDEIYFECVGSLSQQKNNVSRKPSEAGNENRKWDLNCENELNQGCEDKQKKISETGEQGSCLYQQKRLEKCVEDIKKKLREYGVDLDSCSEEQNELLKLQECEEDLRKCSDQQEETVKRKLLECEADIESCLDIQNESMKKQFAECERNPNIFSEQRDKPVARKSLLNIEECDVKRNSCVIRELEDYTRECLDRQSGRKPEDRNRKGAKKCSNQEECDKVNRKLDSIREQKEEEKIEKRDKKGFSCSELRKCPNVDQNLDANNKERRANEQSGRRVSLDKETEKRLSKKEMTFAESQSKEVKTTNLEKKCSCPGKCKPSCIKFNSQEAKASNDVCKCTGECKPTCKRFKDKTVNRNDTFKCVGESLPACDRFKEKTAKPKTETENVSDFKCPEKPVVKKCSCPGRCKPSCVRFKQQANLGPLVLPRRPKNAKCVCTGECDPNCKKIKITACECFQMKTKTIDGDKKCECTGECDPNCKKFKDKTKTIDGDKKCECIGECDPNCKKFKDKTKTTDGDKKCECTGECDPSCKKFKDNTTVADGKLCECVGECDPNCKKLKAKQDVTKKCSCTGECRPGCVGYKDQLKEAKVTDDDKECSCEGECDEQCVKLKKKLTEIPLETKCSCVGECKPNCVRNKAKQSKDCSCEGDCDPSCPKYKSNKPNPWNLTCTCTGECKPNCIKYFDPTTVKTKTCACTDECLPACVKNKQKVADDKCKCEGPCIPTCKKFKAEQQTICTCEGECIPTCKKYKQLATDKCQCTGTCVPTCRKFKDQQQEICKCEGECIPGCRGKIGGNLTETAREPDLVKEASMVATMSAIQVALLAFEEKCKAKDALINAMKDELNKDPDNRTFDKMLDKIAHNKDRLLDNDKITVGKYLARNFPLIQNQPVDPSPLKIMDVRTVDETTILIKWEPSTHSAVVGYEVCVNNISKTRVFSKSKRIAVVEDILLRGNVFVAIYALADGGRCQPPATAVYKVKN